MIARILEIQTPGNFLNVSRGHLVITREKEKVGSIPIDDIGILLISNNACSFSADVFTTLAQKGAQVVLCGENYTPAVTFLPTQSIRHHAERLALQIAASVPLKRRIWTEIVRRKIKNQIAALEALNCDSSPLRPLVDKIQSGDSSNIEAQAAQKYWRLLMGDNFRRNRVAGDVNVLFNYGYTVLRAAMLRAIVACGLHLALPLHHSAKENSTALADDLVEPFRPLIDVLVSRLVDFKLDYLCPEVKKELTSCLILNIYRNDEVSTLPVLMHDFSLSLIESLKLKQVALSFTDLSATFLNMHESSGSTGNEET